MKTPTVFLEHISCPFYLDIDHQHQTKILTDCKVDFLKVSFATAHLIWHDFPCQKAREGNFALCV